jgi:hypothetical protein
MTTLAHTAEGPAPRSDAGSTTTGRVSAAGRPPIWLYVVVIVGALGVLSLAYSALFSPATVIAAGQQVTGPTRTWAHYAAAYNIALGAALLAPLALGAWRVLAGALVQAALAEALLGIVGIAGHRPEQTAADIVLIAAFLLCARRLHRIRPATQAG